jgi:hypothetical protein
MTAGPPSSDRTAGPDPVAAPAPVTPGRARRLARMAGSSIASRDAAVWVTDFLNAAHYRQPVPDRDVDDLRLAFSILTTYWYRRRSPRRLRVTDLRAFHSAYGRRRYDTAAADRGLLTREQLLDGNRRRRGHRGRVAGVHPRLRHDHAPGHRRGSVRVARVLRRARVWTRPLWQGRAACGSRRRPVLGFDLTTHKGHFMGAGHNRLILYTHEGRPSVRAAGTWDPMPWHLEQPYRVAGRAAQHAFWGETREPRLSMLHQVAQTVA